MRKSKIKLEGLRKRGDQVWFEYHCNESHDSAHAELWYHSHQKITILRIAKNDGMTTPSFEERCENGLPICYKIKFSDGYVHTATEDELFDNKRDFNRPDPPKPLKFSKK